LSLADPFEFAEGTVKQLLTLATGSLGGVIALFDDDKHAGVQLAGSWCLFAAIGLLAISMVAGIITLGCLTAQLAQTKKAPSVNANDVRYPAMTQMVTFAFGIIAVAGEVVLR